EQDEVGCERLPPAPVSNAREDEQSDRVPERDHEAGDRDQEAHGEGCSKGATRVSGGEHRQHSKRDRAADADQECDAVAQRERGRASTEADRRRSARARAESTSPAPSFSAESTSVGSTTTTSSSGCRAWRAISSTSAPPLTGSLASTTIR